MQEIVALLAHPDKLNHDTLQQLREVVSAYPYFQAARLAFLQNLYLLHDPTFGEEMRHAALFLPDRRILFDFIEGKHYRIEPPAIKPAKKVIAEEGDKDRTTSLIDSFFASLGENSPTNTTPIKGDVSTDYSAFLLGMDDLEIDETPTIGTAGTQNLIGEYISQPSPTTSQSTTSPSPSNKIEIAPIVAEEPLDTITPEEPTEDNENEFFTETLAKIYIKQGKYEKAIEIIRGLHLIYPKKNRYFADQIRFLQKLIINRNSTKEHV